MTSSTKTRTYVGFGFGAIQAGLFLYEAFRVKNFDRLIVAEVMPHIVAAIRKNQGVYSCNIAQTDGIETAKIGPIQIENPAVPEDRERLIKAIAAAQEISTAIPSVNFYVADGPGSLHRILAKGLRQKVRYHGPRAVIYTAENHNRAAEILRDKVMAEIPLNEQDAALKQVQFLNTVIGKMSGVVTDPAQMQAQRLSAIAPNLERAFLVEAFNKILISKPQFEMPFERGLDIFEEKENLLPFEEAKFYGHNAVHALAAYLGAVRGIEYIADLQAFPGVMKILQSALMEESGAALIQKYRGIDSLFTETGFRRYADNLIERMMNPHLKDTVERVGRDPKRKLGWNDRLIGTMRLALSQGIEPVRFALGSAAALTALDENILGTSKFEESARPVRLCSARGRAELLKKSDLLILENTGMIPTQLAAIWADASPDPTEQQEILEYIQQACHHLKLWRKNDFQNLDDIL